MKRYLHGFTIIEAIIAASLLSIGLLASVKIMVNMRVGNQVAQQRMQAMDYASNALEEMRALGACTSISTNTLSKRANDSAVYTLQATCTGNIARVTVIWNDSRGNQTKVNGADNQVVLDSKI